MSGPVRWGPVAVGGRARAWPLRVVAVAVGLLVAVGVGTVGTAALVAFEVERSRERVAIPTLTQTDEPDAPLNVLVVGSDGRDGLTEAEIDALVLGDFDGRRADTNIVVSITPDRSVINVVSIPRDMVVSDGVGEIAKITETYTSGRDDLVRVVTDDLGLPVNHYVEVSITGFIQTVDAVGGVTMCLDEPLFDRKSGADFEAGCRDFTPEESLAYVRSRQGSLGDFARIERQQTFLRALVERVVDGRLLFQPTRLRDVAAQLGDSVVTDEGLGVGTALDLAGDLQRLVGGGFPTVTVPGYPRDLVDGGVTKNFVVPYGPGLEALVDDVVAGRELPSRGSPAQRADTRVLVWTGDRLGAAGIVESTLLFGGFTTVGGAAGAVDAGATTVVHAAPGAEQQAAWVAAHLGAEVVPLPPGTGLGRDDVDVVVSVGDDATASTYGPLASVGQ